MSDYDNIDLALLHNIDSIREKHNACTARAVAQAVGVSPDVVRYRLQKMEVDGLVKWTDMAGSLTRLALPALVVVEELNESLDEVLVDSAPPPASSSKRGPKPKK